MNVNEINKYKCLCNKQTLECIQMNAYFLVMNSKRCSTRKRRNKENKINADSTTRHREARRSESWKLLNVTLTGLFLLNQTGLSEHGFKMVSKLNSLQRGKKILQ